jgi:hypothetical protein
MSRAAELIAAPFSIPGDTRLADPRLVYPALVQAATEARANIFRTTYGYDLRGKPEITQYALLTGPTRLYRALPLQAGRYLSPEDTLSTSLYLSTAGHLSSAQPGVLAELGGNDALTALLGENVTVTVQPLRAAFSSLPVAGAYFVEPRPGAAAHRPSYEGFLGLLAGALDHRLGGGPARPFPPSSFRSTSPQLTGLPPANTARLLDAIEYLIIAITTLLLVYRLLYCAKRAGIMKLSGFSTARVWYELTAELVLAVMVPATLLASLLSSAVPDASLTFVTAVVTAFARATALMLACSLVTSLYISRIRLSDSVKNRKDIRGIFALNTTVKALCSVGVIVAGTSMVVEYHATAAERAVLGAWDATSHFGIFYPVSVGNDLPDYQTGQPGPTTAEVLQLYPLLNRTGTLYVDSSEYEPVAFSLPMSPGVFRSVQVNPNYLRAYPVRDPAGRVVTVPETDRDWVLLVPEKLRPEQQQILSYFKLTRDAARAAEPATFGDSVPAALRHQQVSIVWVRDGQKIFSFNPLVSPGAGNDIIGPIIQVMTMANSLGGDRANAITGGPDSALKVKLGPAGSQATLRELQPVLRRLHLQDNLQYLVTMNGYVLEKVQALQGDMATIAVIATMLVLGTLVMLGQDLVIAFDRYARRTVVRRLFGLGFWSTYRETLLLCGAVAVAQTAVAMAANDAGLELFGNVHGTAGNLAVLGVAAVIAGLELAFGAAMLLRTERRRTVTVLKEVF